MIMKPRESRIGKISCCRDVVRSSRSTATRFKIQYNVIIMRVARFHKSRVKRKKNKYTLEYYASLPDEFFMPVDDP